MILQLSERNFLGEVKDKTVETKKKKKKFLGQFVLFILFISKGKEIIVYFLTLTLIFTFILSTWVFC